MMKLQSISDVITNSSSEIFVIPQENLPKGFMEILRREIKDHPENNHMSGEGGTLEALPWKDFKESYLDEVVGSVKAEETLEDHWNAPGLDLWWVTLDEIFKEYFYLDKVPKDSDWIIEIDNGYQGAVGIIKKLKKEG